MQHWSDLSSTQRLLLGSVPALTAFALALAMWKLERFRLTFVALIVGILAVPLCTGVWLHEYNVAARVSETKLAYELFHSTAQSEGLTNLQVLIMSLAMLTVAGTVMRFTRTTTHSAQTMIATFAGYSSILLCLGLKLLVDEEKWASVAVRYTPLLLLAGWLAYWLLTQPERSYQAPPWIYFTAALLVGILFAVSFYGLREWTELNSKFRFPASCLLLSLAGAVQTALGLLARRYLKHHGRMATWAVIITGLAGVLVGLEQAGEKWPANWWTWSLFGKTVPVVHVGLPFGSLVITLLACRYQMLAFLMVGLVGFAGSIHLLGYRYFEETPSWPKLLMAIGAACFFLALWLELRRTRGNTLDDALGQSRL